MGDFKNNFTWSRSRDGMFRECHRKYWLTYYGSWGGWNWDADPQVRQTYILKQIQNRWMWAGSLVHDAIAAVLTDIRQGLCPELEKVQEDTIARMRREFVSSRNRYYLQKPKTCALTEHHYALPGTETDWVEVRDHVLACLEMFWNSPFRSEAETLEVSEWLAIEEMDSFLLDGIKVWAIPDFAYRNKKGSVCIVDWKTGRKAGEPDPIQLSCYALYGSQRWKCAPEDIVTVEYNLAHGIGHTQEINSETLREVAEKIRKSIADMQSPLLSITENRAEENAFPRTTDRGACRRCRYKEVCYGADWLQKLHDFSE